MDPIRRSVLALSRFPGIGEKTAQRLTWWLMRADSELVQELSEAIGCLQDSIVECTQCGILSAENPCSVCADPHRIDSVICVVERPQDVHAIDRSGEYRGRYHVLHGALSPLDGIGPDQLRIQSLLARLDGVEEIILATDPDVEGDTTALYLAKLLGPLGLRTSRLAHGIAVGTEIEYADRLSLMRALENRREM
jgi:recombination protein RecR